MCHLDVCVCGLHTHTVCSAGHICAHIYVSRSHLQACMFLQATTARGRSPGMPRVSSRSIALWLTRPLSSVTCTLALCVDVAHYVSCWCVCVCVVLLCSACGALWMPAQAQVVVEPRLGAGRRVSAPAWQPSNPACCCRYVCVCVCALFAGVCMRVLALSVVVILVA